VKKTRFLAFCIAVATALVAGPVLADGGAAEGKKIYAKKCKVCHSIKAGQNKMGPSVAGIFGKKAGSTGFRKYKGLKGSDIVWNGENLDKFLANPKKFLGKKTSMNNRLKGAKKRAAVIEYLKTLK